MKNRVFIIIAIGLIAYGCVKSKENPEFAPMEQVGRSGSSTEFHLNRNSKSMPQYRPLSPIDHAYNEGYEDGLEDGYNDGLIGMSLEGNFDDSNDYEDEDFRQAYISGYEDGYYDGYDEGQSVREKEEKEDD